MPRHTHILRTTALLLAVSVAPLRAQTPNLSADPLTAGIQMGALHVRAMFSMAAEQMSEGDYAYRPTAEVRTFGQLLTHVASTNYFFCSNALGEASPVADLEKTRTTRAEIQKALAESFDYCDRAYLSLNVEANAKATRKFRDTPMPTLSLLNFRNYHGLLHWGNAITYMRLRGKTPPAA